MSYRRAGMGQDMVEYHKGGARQHGGIVSPTDRPLRDAVALTRGERSLYPGPVYRTISGNRSYPLVQYPMHGDDPSLVPAPKQPLSVAAIVGWTAVVAVAAGVFWAVTSGKGLGRNPVRRKSRRAPKSGTTYHIGTLEDGRWQPSRQIWGVSERGPITSSMGAFTTREGAKAAIAKVRGSATEREAEEETRRWYATIKHNPRKHRTRRNPTRAVRRRFLQAVEAGVREGLITKEDAKRFRDAAEADDPDAATELLDAMDRETRRTQSNGRVRRNGGDPAHLITIDVENGRTLRDAIVVVEDGGQEILRSHKRSMASALRMARTFARQYRVEGRSVVVRQFGSEMSF